TAANGTTAAMLDDQVSNADHAPELPGASDLGPLESAAEPSEDKVAEGPPYRKKGGRTAVPARSGR
ncbi:MAG TPA: hypothetical protein VMB91_13525, partial [Solirubrobacteraceae bacterium]|nr:hypothetical protein [Solirubrobacteraceae bacterium]